MACDGIKLLKKSFPNLSEIGSFPRAILSEIGLFPNAILERDLVRIKYSIGRNLIRTVFRIAIKCEIDT